MSSKQTTVTEFRHPETESTITLIGNRHYATKAYMEAIADRLDKCDAAGATIHLEGVREATSKELESLTSRQRHVVDTLLRFGPLLHKVGNLSAQATLHHAISVEDPETGKLVLRNPLWQVHDVSHADLARAANRRQRASLKVVSGMVSLANDALKEDPDAWERTDIEDSSTFRASHWAAAKISSLIMHPATVLLVDYRNEVALNALGVQLEDDPSKDFALLWGQGHVAGLSKGILRRGYIQTGIEELDPDK